MLSRKPRSVVVLLVLLLVAAAEAHAEQCWGATSRRVGIGDRFLRYSGTVTYPGADHANLVGEDGLSLEIRDANDETQVLFRLDVPAERFIQGRRKTRYDREGDFQGRLRIRNRRNQNDTVHIDLRVRVNVDLGAVSPEGVRVWVGSGDNCGLSCVSPCRDRVPGGRLSCSKSAIYVPFEELGFGAIVRRDGRAPKSPLCALSIPSTGPRCDFLIDDHCLLPYPSSAFLDPDPTTPTGLRLQYGATSLPRNVFGTHIDPTDWNTLDGFSPGPILTTIFSDTGFPVDLDASNAAHETDFARSLDANHPTVLLEETTGDRIEHFAELDVQTDDVTKKALMLRPGRRLKDGTRYIVAMRDLVDTQGTPFAARLPFRALRDGFSDAELELACGATCAAAFAARRPGFEDLFDRLEAVGVDRDGLVLAWDFTTASTESLTGWMVAVRDQAFALGTPSFEVTSVDDGGGSGRDANIYARIEGTFQAPLFMTEDAPASRLNLVDGVPRPNGTATVPFVADIPHVAVASENPSATPARATTWGHGLLGTRFQLGTLSELAQGFNFVITAVDMQGMSEPDVTAAIIPLITDLSLFHRIPERLHQGFLNHLLLGRLMNDPVNGFNSHPAFQLGVGGAGVIDTTQVFYSGGSQGGIFGVAIMGVANEFERGFLAVPGANYSTLLQRSIDFEPFFALLNAAYRDELDRILLYPLIQQLWDRAEPQGYIPHVVPGTLSDPPFPHKVLLHMATYDSEVSNLSTEIMVRSLGIPQLLPVHRSFFDVPEVVAPLDASVLVEIDPQRGFSRCHTPGTTDAGAACTTDADCPGAGDPPERTQCASGIPPLANDAPLFNNGAHGSTGTPAAGEQISEFLRTGGQVIQTCTGTCDPE